MGDADVVGCASPGGITIRRSQVSPLPAAPGTVFRNRAVQLDSPSLPPVPPKLAIVIGDGLTGCAPEVAAACDLHVRPTPRSLATLTTLALGVSLGLCRWRRLPSISMMAREEITTQAGCRMRPQLGQTFKAWGATEDFLLTTPS